MTYRLRSLLILSVIGPLAPPPGHTQQPRPIAQDDASRIVRVSDPRISPDGRTVLITVSRADLESNVWRGQVVAVDVATGAQTPVAADLRGAGSPQWSPTGDRIAVLANGSAPNSGRQVWILPPGGGSPRAVTTAPRGVLQFAWSPDGRALAYTATDPRPERTGTDRFNDAFEVGSDHYMTTAPPEAAHLWVTDISTGAAKRLTEGAGSVRTMLRSPGISWSADGRTIALVRFPSASPGDSDQGVIQVIEVASGAMRGATSRSTGEGDVSPAPTGGALAYTWPRDGDPANLSEVWVTDQQGTLGRRLTGAIDRDVGVVDWLPGGTGLLLSGPDRTRTAVWTQPLNGPARRLDLGPLASVGGISLAPTGAIALVGSEPTRPPELYLKSSLDGAPRRLTDFNAGIASLQLGRTERIAWDGPDGLPGDGVLTWPPDFRPGQRRPLVLLVHGGPTASSNEGFSFRAQLLAAQGWVVFQPNYRGSNNLGNAYQRAIANDAGEGPGRDVMAGIDAVVALGGVDPDRMAVSGWSYGGYMTAWLIGRYPDRWRAAVAGAAPVDITDMSSLTDLNVMTRHAITASPWVGGNLQRALEMSPLLNLPRIRTPTLILSNTGDVRVVVTGSYKLLQALKANNVPVQFIAYPIGGHSPSDPIRQMDVDRRWVEWLGRYLGPEKMVP